MKLYNMAGACSLAPHIALREAGIPVELIPVDWETRKGSDGVVFNEINPKGYVPALVLEDGTVLTEAPVLLEYIANQKPDAGLAPRAGTLERYRFAEWTTFIAAEIHKPYSILFTPNATKEMKQYATDALDKRIGWLSQWFGSHQYLLGQQYSVADSYLFVVLSWSDAVSYDLSRWPNIKKFQERIGSRPHVVAALKAEGLLK